MNLDIVILAAGNGSRMQSATPKVLHRLAGMPMLEHVIKTASLLKPNKLFVIYGYEGERIKAAFPDEQITWVHQKEQLGTGHAVLQALDFIDDTHQVLVLSGDVPLLSEVSLHALLRAQEKASLALLTANFSNPHGLGRIMRNENQKVLGIVEERDANTAQKALKEIYSGVLAAEAKVLKKWLPTLTTDNAQKEIYLTAIVSKAVSENHDVATYLTPDSNEVLGVNDRKQLQTLEREYQQNIATRLMLEGVTIIDSARFDVRGTLQCEKDVVIDVNVVFEGNVILEEGVVIAPHCVIKDAHIKKGATILSHTVIENAIVGEKASVGPFARLRPGTELKTNSKVGNFVEMKKTLLGEGAKVNHLSYVGDATIGRGVNVGAGTITCNYDGVNKHKTVIDEGAFIGSGTQLVAPVHVGRGATIGAGTTLRRNAPAEKLTLSMKSQKTLDNWTPPKGDRG
jgi:bifunctional UDP-N-acetylglucosamine pyrophosphorylase/glucosamine-1-phosphate N-acetyltransferase